MKNKNNTTQSQQFQYLIEKNEERGEIDAHNTHIRDRLLSRDILNKKKWRG